MALPGDRVKKEVGEGLAAGRRRKLKPIKTNDELAPLWEDLRLSILKAVRGGGNGTRYKDVKDITPYTAYRADGERWTPQ